MIAGLRFQASAACSKAPHLTLERTRHRLARRGKGHYLFAGGLVEEERIRGAKVVESDRSGLAHHDSVVPP